MKPAKVVQWSMGVMLCLILLIPFSIAYAYNPVWGLMFALVLIWMGVGFAWSTTDNDRWGTLWFSCTILAGVIITDNTFAKVIFSIVFLFTWCYWLYKYLKDVVRPIFKTSTGGV